MPYSYRTEKGEDLLFRVACNCCNGLIGESDEVALALCGHPQHVGCLYKYFEGVVPQDALVCPDPGCATLVHRPGVGLEPVRLLPGAETRCLACNLDDEPVLGEFVQLECELNHRFHFECWANTTRGFVAQNKISKTNLGDYQNVPCPVCRTTVDLIKSCDLIDQAQPVFRDIPHVFDFIKACIERTHEQVHPHLSASVKQLIQRLHGGPKTTIFTETIVNRNRKKHPSIMEVVPFRFILKQHTLNLVLVFHKTATADDAVRAFLRARYGRENDPRVYNRKLYVGDAPNVSWEGWQTEPAAFKALESGLSSQSRVFADICMEDEAYMDGMVE